MALAHTATSYTLGRPTEEQLVLRRETEHQVPYLTAFGSVVSAPDHPNVTRIALGAPYGEEITLKGMAHLELFGLESCTMAGSKT